MHRLATFLTTISILLAGSTADLFEAARNGDQKQVEALVQTSVDANRKSVSGVPILMLAALHGSPEMVKLLLSRGAAPNQANPVGATALHWAAGSPAKVEMLLKAGADANAKSNLGRTPLTIAAATAGNAASLRLLLKAGANPKLVDSSGDGPLGNAASAADPEMIRILLRAGASVHERGHRGPAMREMTPLTRAAGMICPECVKLLLEAGSDPNAVSAVPRVIKAGLQDLGQLYPLAMATQRGDAASTRLLLAAGAKLDLTDARGLTPLLFAATSESQDASTFDLLVKQGAKLEQRTKEGECAADWIAKFGAASPLGSRVALQKAAKRDVPERPALAPSPQEAVSKSLSLLLSSNAQFFGKSGCVGCHHQILGGMLAAEARKHKVAFPQEIADKQLAETVAVSQANRETTLQRVPLPGAPLGESILLVSLGEQGVSASPLTDGLVHDVAGLQQLDGSWRGLIQRPPLESYEASETAWTIRALKLYGSAGRRAEFDARIERGRKWLQALKPEFTEEFAMKVLGLHWSGAKPDLKPLLALQRPDGGWSQRPGFAPDAYATGQALYALAEAGLPVSDARFKKGVKWLLENQAKDGSWFVASRSLKFQPYFDSGFPYEHDQWVSAAATAWAGLALTKVI